MMQSNAVTSPSFDPFADPIQPPLSETSDNGWRTEDPYASNRLPPNDALTWEEKDRFVRMNSRVRQDRKKEVAVTGGAALAAGTLLGGLIAATAGIAAPLIAGAAVIAVATGYTGTRLATVKPDGIRKHVFSDYDRDIAPKTSSLIVADLKTQGIYKNGRTRRFLQADNVTSAVENNGHIPLEKRGTFEALIRFHKEDVAWRAGVDQCLRAYKAEFKHNWRPSRKVRNRDPQAMDRYEATRAFKGDLKALKAAMPSRRCLAREWIEKQRIATLEVEKQAAYDDLLASLDRQARI